MLLPYMNVYSKTSWKLYQKFTQTKLMSQEKSATSRFNYKKMYVLLTVHKLYEHCFWQNWLNFHDTMDQSSLYPKESCIM